MPLYEEGLVVKAGCLGCAEMALLMSLAASVEEPNRRWVGAGTLTARGSNGPPTHVSAWWTLQGEGSCEGMSLELHGEPLNERMEEVWWGIIYPTEATPPGPDPV